MNASPASRARLRHVPNALSAMRIAAVPVLIVLAATRRFELQSQLGALLDSIADTLPHAMRQVPRFELQLESPCTLMADGELLSGVTRFGVECRRAAVHCVAGPQ